jgi:hypothetical protein
MVFLLTYRVKSNVRVVFSPQPPARARKSRQVVSVPVFLTRDLGLKTSSLETDCLVNRAGWMPDLPPTSIREVKIL